MSEEDRRRWNERYRAAEHQSLEPCAFLVGVAPQLPAKGRALDLAGGTGRHALWLARRGLDVTLADVSEVGLALARERAAEAGVVLTTLEHDFETGDIPAGPWDLIVCIHYLERRIFPRLPEALAPGGSFVFVQPTVRNLERHPRPPRPFLLDEGELATLVPPALGIVQLDEGWTSEGRHEAQLLARR